MTNSLEPQTNTYPPFPYSETDLGLVPAIGGLAALRDSFWREREHYLAMTGDESLNRGARELYGHDSDALLVRLQAVDKIIDGLLGI